MVKVLHYSLNNISKNYKNPYKIILLDNILSLIYTHSFNNTDKEYKIDINITSDNKAYDIMFREDESCYTLSLIEIFNYVDNNTGIRDVQYKGKKIARIVFDNNDIYILLSIACTDIPNIENEIISNNKSSTKILIDNIAWVSDRFKKIHKKSKLLNDVDLYRTISYLEAQIDVLTRVIIKLVKDDELKTVIKLFDDNSVLNIKPIDDIKNEVINKCNFRRNQELYYERLKEKQ